MDEVITLLARTNVVQLVIDECFIIKFEIFHIFVPAIIVRPDNWALER